MGIVTLMLWKRDPDLYRSHYYRVPRSLGIFISCRVPRSLARAFFSTVMISRPCKHGVQKHPALALSTVEKGVLARRQTFIKEKCRDGTGCTAFTFHNLFFHL